MPYSHHHAESVTDKTEGFVCFTVNDAKKIFGMDTGNNVDYTAITIYPSSPCEGELVTGLDKARVEGFGKWSYTWLHTNNIFAWNVMARKLIIKLIQKYQQTGINYLEPSELSDEELKLGRESRYQQRLSYYQQSWLVSTRSTIQLEDYDLTIVVLANGKSLTFNKSGSIDIIFDSRDVWGYSPSKLSDEEIQAVYEVCIYNSLF